MTPLAHDLDHLPDLLASAQAEALHFLNRIGDIPPAADVAVIAASPLPDHGAGAEAALQDFRERFVPGMTASTGPRYWGFVTGGTTPAALVGDWLASAYDINLADRSHSSGPSIELEAIAMLRALFGLPERFGGVFVSGATMANFTGLAMGREWASQQRGTSAAQHGMRDILDLKVLSAEPHSSSVKALAMLGLGRDALVRVERLPDNREAMDVAALRKQLEALNGAPCIVVASGGTVNTVDFDEFNAIAALRQEFPFWLHIDAAFGGFAAASPRYAHLMSGIEYADSLTIDAHKWLNVPYDSAMVFSPHTTLQTDVFQNSAAYLGDLGAVPDFFHLTPENSRRFRALPAWFTLRAYGRDGYREIVERACDIAGELGKRIEASETFRLLAPVRMNVVCFTVAGEPPTQAQIMDFLQRLRDGGRLFLTPTRYDGVWGIRAALVNWRTTMEDLEIAWAALNGVFVAQP